jgi:hypothetical protein
VRSLILHYFTWRCVLALILAALLISLYRFVCSLRKIWATKTPLFILLKCMYQARRERVVMYICVCVCVRRPGERELSCIHVYVFVLGGQERESCHVYKHIHMYT